MVFLSHSPYPVRYQTPLIFLGNKSLLCFTKLSLSAPSISLEGYYWNKFFHYLCSKIFNGSLFCIISNVHFSAWLQGSLHLAPGDSSNLISPICLCFQLVFSLSHKMSANSSLSWLLESHSLSTLSLPLQTSFIFQGHFFCSEFF